MKRFRKMRLFQIRFLALFAIILLASIVFSLVPNLSYVSLVLLLIDFVIALVVAIFGSLSIREEEEEIS